MAFNKTMMKKIFLIVMICFSGCRVKAQTFDEWFRQKKTQIQYLTDQIAALQVYGQSLEKGYKIADEGLKFIHGIKKGDLDLHQFYFSSLKKVNPQVKSYTKIAGIILIQTAIIKACNKQKMTMVQSREFSNDELSYAAKVLHKLLDGCGQIIDQLTDVLMDGNFEMKDGERLKMIDHLYDHMQDRYVFIQHFGNEANILCIQRMKDQNDVKTLREDYGIY
jgi:hypothetical protein